MADVELEDWTDFWLLRLLLNLAGYATIIVPGYLLIRYIRKSGYLDKPGDIQIMILVSVHLFLRDWHQ